MKSLRPVLSLLRGFVAQLHPLAPTRYHLRYALRLANLERPS
jgi:hypothetical protein